MQTNKRTNKQMYNYSSNKLKKQLYKQTTYVQTNKRTIIDTNKRTSKNRNKRGNKWTNKHT